MAGSRGEIIGAIVPFILLSFCLRTGRKWLPSHTPAPRRGSRRWDVFEPPRYLFLWARWQGGGDRQCAKGFRVWWERGRSSQDKNRASVVRKKEILPFMVTRLSLQDNTLSGVNQREKDKNYEVSLIYVIEKTTGQKRVDWCLPGVEDGEWMLFKVQSCS